MIYKKFIIIFNIPYHFLHIFKIKHLSHYFFSFNRLMTVLKKEAF